MKQSLELTSFDVPASEAVVIRTASQRPTRGARLWTSTKAGRGQTTSTVRAGRLVMARTIQRSLKWHAAGLLIWVLAWGHTAQANQVRGWGAWAEGVIVASDPAHKTFTLSQRGRRGVALLAWNGQTHTWNGNELTHKGKAVDAGLLQADRPVRVLVERTRRGLVARRIILFPRPTLGQGVS